MKVVALAGGTGSAKLLRGLSRLVPGLTVIANAGDNVWIHGLYVCPDIDIAMYTLARIADRTRGWGIEGDTFNALAQLRKAGAESWFKLGDRDLACSVLRTKILRDGNTLTYATDFLRRALGVKARIVPATDDPVETRVRTPGGWVHFQDFWVRQKGRPRALGVRYRGASRARPTNQVSEALLAADRIVICPANPVTSIGPMLAVPGFARLLSQSRGRVSALSPMAGSAPYSGPAGKFMQALRIRPDSVGVAEMYSRFLDVLIIDRRDAALSKEIEGMGVACVTSDSRLGSPADEKRLAREMLRV